MHNFGINWRFQTPKLGWVQELIQDKRYFEFNNLKPAKYIYDQV